MQTSCWVCREESVRQHFSWIVWCTLGQTPELIKSMGSVYLQLTGRELQDSTVEDAKEKLRHAFRGKDVLLILDDIWQKDDELLLNFLDDASENKSRCLLSSRVESVLEDCDIVEIGLPSQNEAVQMLLYAAGVDAKSKPPKEAMEICRFCKMLPLHIGIAGKIIRSMGVENDADWSGVVEELQATESHSVADAIILSGMRSLPAVQRDGAAMLFKCFAYVPEDCRVPFEMMQLLLETQIAAGNSPPTRLALRRWLKLLIDRSLVLGPIDGPSLHDIVRDHVLSQQTASELAAGHCRVVEAVRADRPKRGWIPEEMHPLARYLLTNIDFHLREAGEAVQIMYVDDFLAGLNVNGRTDAIPVGCARVLGPDRVERLADEAAARGADWVAAKRFAAAALANIQLRGHGAATPQWLKCAAACETVRPLSSAGGGGCTTDMLTQLHFRAVNWIMKSWDPAVQAKFGQDLARLGECEIIKAEPEAIYVTKMFTKLSPTFSTGDVFLLGSANNELMNLAGQNYSGSSRGTFESAVWLCRKFIFEGFCLDCGIRSLRLTSPGQEFDWDSHAGYGGRLYLESALAFDWANMHAMFTINVSTNNFICGGPLFGYVLRWGTAGHATQMAAKMVQDVKLTIEKFQSGDNTETLNMVLIACTAVWMHWLAGDVAGAQLIATRAGSTLDEADAYMDTLFGIANFIFRARGQEGSRGDGGFWGLERLSWHLKCVAVTCLLDDDDDIRAKATPLMATCPDPDEMAHLGMCFPTHDQGNTINATTGIVIALAHERVAMCKHSDELTRRRATASALEHAARISENQELSSGEIPVGGLANGSEHNRWAHSIAHRCRGRLLAADGQEAGSHDAFEAAALAARLHGYNFLESLALTEMIEHTPRLVTPAQRARCQVVHAQLAQ
jgi:hypothetical protein